MHELQLKKTLTALIYGQKGSGKTTLALSADPNSLLIDTDNGVDRVSAEHLITSSYIQVQSFDEILKDLRTPEAQAFSTIIIDTLGKLIEYMIEYTRKNTAKNPSVGGLSQQNWGVLNATFKNFCREVRMMNKNLIFVAHETTEKRSDELRLVPEVRASNYTVLATELDLIGYVECVGSQRTLSFTPTDKHDGKNTGGFDEVINIPALTAGMANNFLAENVIKKHFDNVATKEKLQTQIVAKLKDIDALLANVDAANSANIFIDEIKKIEHLGNSLQYAQTKFKEKTKLLGLKLNPETKMYSDAQQVQAEVSQQNIQTPIPPPQNNLQPNSRSLI
jgi:hypothetical protein